jgi:hypothetical protein
LPLQIEALGRQFVPVISELECYRHSNLMEPHMIDKNSLSRAARSGLAAADTRFACELFELAASAVTDDRFLTNVRRSDA